MGSMSRLILASQSPRRKKLLTEAGVSFDTVTSNYLEDMTLDLPPHRLVEVLAKGKADDVVSRYKDMGRVILGADTIVCFGKDILGKPEDIQDARKILGMLSGQEHSVITGFAIVDTDSELTRVGNVLTKVVFKKLTTKLIDDYIDTGQPLDKAGAYGIQDELGEQLVERIDGDYDNVVGLPVSAVLAELKTFDIPKE